MKLNITKYAMRGALIACGGLLISCDGDKVRVNEYTPDYEAQENAKNKPIAPPVIAQLPLQSLKIAFFNGEGACFASGFSAGEEIEIDIDTVDVTSAAATTGNAIGDFEFEGGRIRDIDVELLSIESNPASTSWTIQTIRELNGETILTNLLFTPLASDQRSVTGRVTASGVVEVQINQDSSHVVGSAELDVDFFGQPVKSVTVYQDVAGNPAEITNGSGGTVHDSGIGSGNYAVSIELADSDCVINYVWEKDATEGATGGLGFTALGLEQLVAAIEVANPADLDVSPAGDQITSNSPLRHLIAGQAGNSLEGSYRLDFDSSIGSGEGNIDITGSNR